jgi:hypothetical protein
LGVKLSYRDFMRELWAERDRLKRDIEARRLALDPSPEARRERRRRVLVGQDYWWWATTYFPHYIRGEGSSFQRHFCQRVPLLLRAPGGCVEWWIAPRGEAKSSLATKLLPIWCTLQALLQRDEIRTEVGWDGEPPPFVDYILLLSAETRLPTKALDAIKVELENNPSLALDWPEACGRGRIWKVGEALTATGVKIEPFGAEQAVRGTAVGASRPKLLIPDDLITDAEAKSPAERDNRWTWVTRALEYLGPPDGTLKTLGVGTVLNPDDPISRAKKTPGHLVHHFRALEREPERMDLWGQCEVLMRDADRPADEAAAARGDKLDLADLPSARFYRVHKKAMDKGARVSWPGVRDLYALMRMRVRAARAFATEMQGEGNTEDRVFGSWSHWTGQAGPHWVWYGAVDPSMGSRDPSGILWGAWDPASLTLHVRRDDVRRRAPSKLRADLVRGQREFRAAAIAFENNNAYEDMRRTSIAYGQAQGTPLPLIGVTAVDSPQVRIESLEPFLTDPIAPDPQPGHHYEALTCLYMLWVLATSRAQKYDFRRVANDATAGLSGQGIY